MPRFLMIFAIALGSVACSNLNQVLDTGAQVSQAVGYSPAQLNSAVKEALQLSVTRATDQLGQSGGYTQNNRWRLGLPESVEPVVGTLRQLGLGGPLDEVEKLMNRGAELAAAEAKLVFLQAVKDMPVQDAIGIIRSGGTAATDYFRSATEAQLTVRYKSIMQNQLQQLGFYKQYQQVLNTYKAIPLANKPELDFEQYAVNRGLAALYGQIAEEEQKIRANPVEQGSALIAAIFTKQ
ncbi:DUF4197 domain-containing protein [Saccharophagus sp. K07]|jgi:hypothetical protein|uniref:DUF4197 domain-containing protein n=1 Tax=Saccharophagus sp. K07 TaxID=2283636 RepID=UPI0016521C32|nr:DUF4197 domain-containing protein [Saccharophagus sp. K07]MBC6906209.1 DUF4197 domain-containing protein [Saccharophagus sp. K07]